MLPVATVQAGLAEADLAERYSAGLRQMDRGDLAEAAGTVAAILEEGPSYRDAPALLARAREDRHASAAAPVHLAVTTPSPPEVATEPPGVADSPLSAEPPQPDMVQEPDSVGDGPAQQREGRQLRLGAGLAIVSAVMIIGSSCWQPVSACLPYGRGWKSACCFDRGVSAWLVAILGLGGTLALVLFVGAIPQTDDGVAWWLPPAD
jgi:hypothetical protein